MENLSKSYPTPDGKLDVLNGLTFQVARGEFLAITGPSGSGKTTLLALLGALDRPDAGEIWLHDIPVHTLRGLAAARFRRQKVGFVFQLFYLLPTLTALENVMAPLIPFRHELDFDVEQRACELLESVGLSQRRDHLPARLSGGEQQRVAIARALLNRPAVVLADEPTGNLDPATGLEVLEVLRTLQKTGEQTLVLVRHDPSVAIKADRRLRLRPSAAGLEVEEAEVLHLAAPRHMFVPSAEHGASEAPTAKRGISRRAVVTGIVGGAAVLAVGSVAWFELQSKSSPAPGLGSTLSIYYGHSESVNAISWSPDGKSIASASAPLPLRPWRSASVQKRQEILANIQSNSATSTMHVWNPATGRDFASYRGHNGGVATVAWSPDSKRLASGGLFDATVRLWDALSGKNVLTHGDTANLTQTQPALDTKQYAGAIWSVAWSPDGTRIASGDEHHRVQVWDPATGQVLVVYDQHRGPINALSWSPDGMRMASASDDGTVQVWDATNGKQKLLYRGQASIANAVLWAPDGQSIISAGTDNTIWVWDANNGNPIWLYKGHTGTINALAWSPDNTQLTSASTDKTVRLWDNWQNGTGKLLYTYRGHTYTVIAVTWSADGTRIASGSSDKTVRIWLATNP